MYKTFSCIFFFLLTNLFVYADDDSIVFSEAEILSEFTTRIPFKVIDHLIVVEAELLNKKGNFIIDTGSESLILNKVHFDFNELISKKDNSTSGVLSTIDNPLERRLKDFVIHNLSLSNVKSDVIDLSHIETTKRMNLLGIIGFNILKDYEVFIDLYLNQITLSKVDTLGKKLDEKVYLEKITDSIDFTLINHSIVFKGQVNDQSVKFALDSGAEYNQINKSVNKKVLKFFKPKKRLILSGASDRKVEVLAGKLHRVKLSETIYFGPMYTVLTNLRKMNEAFGTNVDGVLGYEFFQQKRTIINYKKEKLYFIDYPLGSY